jgi:hypothetical protein
MGTIVPHSKAQIPYETEYPVSYAAQQGSIYALIMVPKDI